MTKERADVLEAILVRIIRVISDKDVFTIGDVAGELHIGEPFNMDSATEGEQARQAWKDITVGIDPPLECPAVLREMP